MPQFASDVFTILLVDDREDNIIALQEILENENRQFVRALSGNEALKHVLKNENIGLVMLDVQMPEMDGFEVARLIKSNPKTKDISIIFVTAINKGEQYVLQGFSEGAVDYLQKPLDISITRAKVKVFEQLYFYQKKLKELLSETEYINKQLERFVYIVSHDLKSPLASIVTILSILEKDGRITTHRDLCNHIEMLSQSANHLTGMITALLDYSKKSVAEQAAEETDVAELVFTVGYFLYPPPNITVQIVTDMPVFFTRRLKLMQVFQNLIGNAVKYNDKPVGRIEVGCTPRDNHYEFFVRDNGPGIAKKDEQKIFYLFEVTENKAKNESSTGVGLNIMKMLVEEQGGRFWVESEEGKGSCFYFEWQR